MQEIRDFIGEFSESQGISFLGAVSLDRQSDISFFKKWLDDNKHADMNFLENYLDLRSDPRKLFESAKTAFVFGMPYYLGDKHSKKAYPSPRIAQYARLKDYHKQLKKILEKLVLEIEGKLSLKFRYQVTVDSAPVLERALAAKTEMGFIGKNTCYIHPSKGSFYLLGELIVDLDFISDRKVKVDNTKRTAIGGCGSCKRCQIHCPTNALSKDYQLDANLCLSYWSIESRGTIPEKYWKWFEFYYFGCDICQLVCPYNRGELQMPKDEWIRIKTEIDLFDVATMNQIFYEQTFGGSPMTRAKIHGLRRNALIALLMKKDSRLHTALGLITEKDHKVLKDTKIQIISWLKNNS